MKQTTGRRKSLWVSVLVLILVGSAAYQTGYLGLGTAKLRSMVFPRDEALLDYVPSSTRTMVIVDIRALDTNLFQSKRNTLKSKLDIRRKAIKETTDIDMFFDVDKVVWADSVVVARGRFHPSKIVAAMKEHSYESHEIAGVTVMEQWEQDSLAIVDSSTILYGSHQSVERALLAHKEHHTMQKSEKNTQRLRDVGWSYPILVTYGNNRAPSIGNILQGQTSSMAVTFGIKSDAKKGLNIDGIVDASSEEQAKALMASFEEQKTSELAGIAFLFPQASKWLHDVLLQTKVTRQENQSRISFQSTITEQQWKDCKDISEEFYQKWYQSFKLFPGFL
jgi:hypothetical protein